MTIVIRRISSFASRYPTAFRFQTSVLCSRTSKARYELPPSVALYIFMRFRCRRCGTNRTNNVSKNAKYFLLNLALLGFYACDFLIFQDLRLSRTCTGVSPGWFRRGNLVSRGHCGQPVSRKYSRCTYPGSYICFLRELCILTCKSIPINNVANSRAKPTEDIASSSEVTRFFSRFLLLSTLKERSERVTYYFTHLSAHFQRTKEQRALKYFFFFHVVGLKGNGF